MTVLSSSFFSFYPQAALVELTQDSNPNDAEQRAQLVAAEAAYTSALGFETQHCSLAARQWWNAQIEAEGEIAISRDEQQRLLDLVVQSEVWDAFMQRKVPAVKRYGLEGAEGLMPAVAAVLERGAETGVKDVCIGMAHRGRLNLLTGLLGYPAEGIFHKIAGGSEVHKSYRSTGDVLSHIGVSSKVKTEHGNVYTVMMQNPSHLEAINPVMTGKVRARQDLDTKSEPLAHMGLQIHGDAAMAGQGVVHETLVFSKLRAFDTAGSVHIVTNNQIGFTATSDLGRSSMYCTDVAKMVDAPVIHVNGEHVEDVVRACRLAVDYRNEFGGDVFVDVVGYRRRGHNEVDEPAFTQPKMYETVRAKETLAKTYASELIEAGVVTQADVDAMYKKHDAALEEAFAKAPKYKAPKNFAFAGRWKGLRQVKDAADLTAAETGVDGEHLLAIGKASVAAPDAVAPHQRVQRAHVQARLDKLSKGVDEPLDWATVEAMALGSLLDEGHNVRMCGQDSGRGTFSHRYAELVCTNTEHRHVPLNHLHEKQGKFHIVNSPLSELSVLGFEYGYSTEDPQTLTIWEAQFGDFFNTAQVIIDTFISSGEIKWLRQSGLTILLPHGMDGTGPEHSSARLERWLQMCDADTHDINMQVALPSTPANYFHLLRRQQLRPFRKPLVIMAPKSLLRLAAAQSSVADLAPGTAFQPVIGDVRTADKADKVRRVVLCTGRLFYTLDAHRAEHGIDDIALVRVEEFCPFPADALDSALAQYDGVDDVVWAQEESKNNGAWSFLQPRFSRDVRYVGRAASAAPATGLAAQHKEEHAAIMAEVFA